MNTVHYYVRARYIDNFFINIIRKLIFYIRKSSIFPYWTIIYLYIFKIKTKVIFIVLYWFYNYFRRFKLKAPIHKKRVEESFDHNLKLIFKKIFGFFIIDGVVWYNLFENILIDGDYLRMIQEQYDLDHKIVNNSECDLLDVV